MDYLILCSEYPDKSELDFGECCILEVMRVRNTLYFLGSYFEVVTPPYPDLDSAKRGGFKV